MVRFVPATSGTYFGQSMTADDIYTIAGNDTAGYSGNAGAATSAELDAPGGVAFDSAGDLAIADSTNNVVRFVPGDLGHLLRHVHDGRRHLHHRRQRHGGLLGRRRGGHQRRAVRSRALSASTPPATWPSPIPTTASSASSPRPSATYYGQSMTADDIYTIAGNNGFGNSGNGGAATSAEMNYPDGVAIDASGDVVVADYLELRGARRGGQLGHPGRAERDRRRHLRPGRHRAVLGRRPIRDRRPTPSSTAPPACAPTPPATWSSPTATATSSASFRPPAAPTTGMAMTAHDMYTVAGDGTAGLLG